MWSKATTGLGLDGSATCGQPLCCHGDQGTRVRPVCTDWSRGVHSWTIWDTHTCSLLHTQTLTHTHSHTVALIITIPQTPNSSYSKLLKVCRFLATLLVKLVRVRKPTNCHMWIGGLLWTPLSFRSLKTPSMSFVQTLCIYL